MCLHTWQIDILAAVVTQCVVSAVRIGCIILVDIVVYDRAAGGIIGADCDNALLNTLAPC